MSHYSYIQHIQSEVQKLFSDNIYTWLYMLHLTLIYKCSVGGDVKLASTLLDSRGYIAVKQVKILRNACK